MVTFGEILRWLVYRVKRSYFRFARRVLRGDRLLWRSERKFRALLESAPEAMVIIDAHSHIALVNEQAERLFGYERREIVGRHAGDLVDDVGQLGADIFGGGHVWALLQWEIWWWLWSGERVGAG